MAGSDRSCCVATLTGLALLAAGCGSARHTTSTRIAAPPTRVLAARYLAVANAGNRRLELAFDPLEHRDRNNLARAEADLRGAAATERLFDRRLLAISFPQGTNRVARTLYEVNQVRARLTTAASRSKSLAVLRQYERELKVANMPVEQAVRKIRGLLGLPPPPSG